MCIKCGCGKKIGQAGYGMGPNAKAPMKRVAKKAVVKKMGKKK